MKFQTRLLTVGLFLALVGFEVSMATATEAEVLGAVLARGVQSDSQAACHTFLLNAPNSTAIVRLDSQGEVTDVINLWSQVDRDQFQSAAKILELHTESIVNALPVDEAYKSDPWRNSAAASAVVEQVKLRALPKLKIRPNC